MVAKSYMNAAQKQAFILGSAAGTAIGTVLDQVETHIPKPVAADMKRGRTYLTKALTAWMEPVEDKTKQAVMRQARGVNIGVISDTALRPQQEAYVKYIRDVREQAYQDGGRDFVYDMAEYTLTTVCRTCDGMHKDACPLYAAYRHFEIEFWNANHPRCEYSGVGNVVEV